MLNEEVKQQAKKKKKYNTINKRQREVGAIHRVKAVLCSIAMNLHYTFLNVLK